MGETMREIRITDLCKSFDGQSVLERLNLCIPVGETTCLMGPSGCGKTTLLRILAGLETADSGTVEGMPGKITMLFQEDRLCEEFSAVVNIRLVTGGGMTKQKIREHLLELGLSEESLRQPTAAFSGGMKRRVALARAVCAGGEVLLMDEPFKGLDTDTRQVVVDYWKRHTAGKTVLCVTHDEREAQLLGGTCIRMKDEA